MGDTTIEWTATRNADGTVTPGKTWNPTRGCSRISPGCGGPGNRGGCYAEGIAARFSGPGLAYEGLAEMRDGKPRWTGKIAEVADHLYDPIRWREPRRIFVNSMSDLFHEALPDAAIDKVLAVMLLTPRHTHMVLTKRAARMQAYLSDRNLYRRVLAAVGVVRRDNPRHNLNSVAVSDPLTFPARWIWLGVSVENQRYTDRIPFLLMTPAAVRWLSIEPMLGPVDLLQVAAGPLAPQWKDHRVDVLRAGTWNLGMGFTSHSDMNRVDWVVCGGESGDLARPMHPAWARSLRDQCAEASTPFFFKQHGEWAPGTVLDGPAPHAVDLDGAHRPIVYNSDHLTEGEHLVWRVGKHRAGRLLDGVEHSAFPVAR